MKKNKQLVESYKKRLMKSIVEDVNLHEVSRELMAPPGIVDNILSQGRRLGRWAGDQMRGGSWWRQPGTNNVYRGINPSLLRFMYNRNPRMFRELSGRIFRETGTNPPEYFIHRYSKEYGSTRVFQVMESPPGSGRWIIDDHGRDLTGPDGFGRYLEHYDPETGTWGGAGNLPAWLIPLIPTLPTLQEPEDDYIDSPPPSSDGPMYAGLDNQGTRNNPYL